MAMRPLGALDSVDPREAWDNEAHDFTPWLADNLGHLATAIGIELEREGTEMHVGPLRADIVARNPRDDSRVLIENQLEHADLHHLGQVLAYLAGLEAKTVVWVAKGFDEAHLSALRWLNEHTAESFAFFAVRVRVVRIGDSPLAPVFEVLERPNDWDRRVQDTAQTRELTKLGQFRRDFWAHVSKRHPGEAPPGCARSNVYGSVEGADPCIVAACWASRCAARTSSGPRGLRRAPRRRPASRTAPSRERRASAVLRPARGLRRVPPSRTARRACRVPDGTGRRPPRPTARREAGRDACRPTRRRRGPHRCCRPSSRRCRPRSTSDRGRPGLRGTAPRPRAGSREPFGSTLASVGQKTPCCGLRSGQVRPPRREICLRIQLQWR